MRKSTRILTKFLFKGLIIRSGEPTSRGVVPVRSQHDTFQGDARVVMRMQFSLCVGHHLFQSLYSHASHLQKIDKNKIEPVHSKFGKWHSPPEV